MSILTILKIISKTSILTILKIISKLFRFFKEPTPICPIRLKLYFHKFLFICVITSVFHYKSYFTPSSSPNANHTTSFDVIPPISFLPFLVANAKCVVTLSLRASIFFPFRKWSEVCSFILHFFLFHNSFFLMLIFFNLFFIRCRGEKGSGGSIWWLYDGKYMRMEEFFFKYKNRIWFKKESKHKEKKSLQL